MKKAMTTAVLLIGSTTTFACNAKVTMPHQRVSAAATRHVERSSSQYVTKTTERDRKWHAATYKGLVIGKSTQEEMFNVLGKPVRTNLAAGQSESDPKPIIWNEYEWSNTFEGRLIVEADKSSKLIIGMIILPVNLSKGDAIKYFGEGYIITRYEFDPCRNDEEGDDVRLYESPTGQFMYVEYRDSGIALKLDEQNKVQEILYLSENDSIGAESPKCKPK